MLVPNTNHASEVSVLRLALGLSDRLVSLAPWPPPADRNLADCMADWLEERAGIREHDGNSPERPPRRSGADTNHTPAKLARSAGDDTAQGRLAPPRRRARRQPPNGSRGDRGLSGRLITGVLRKTVLYNLSSFWVLALTSRQCAQVR